MTPDWDRDSPELRANLERVAEELLGSARRRDPPALELALGWHRGMMAGLTPPDAALVGRLRGEPPLEQIGVRVGPCMGTEPDRVAVAVDAFIRRLTRAVDFLDGVIAPDARPADADQLEAVLALMARAHAEWVKIHPFGNGNGRTARLWANWVALRYGVPAFVRLRPRPEGDGYLAAARAALCDGDLDATLPVFRRMHARWLDAHA